MVLLQNPRQLRGLAILSGGEGAVARVNNRLYRVKSQSGNGEYEVKSNGAVWTCACPDFQTRGSTCKHVFAVLFSKKLRLQARFDVEEETPPEAPAPADASCPKCGVGPLLKKGIRKTGKGEVQRFGCRGCGHRFTMDRVFSRMKHDPKAITLTMDLYFKGVSLRKITDHLKQFYGVEVAATTPMRWIRKYMALLTDYADRNKAEAGQFWHCDEMTVNVRKDGAKRNLEWIWNLMDHDTRFLLACRITKARTNEDARRVILDATDRAKEQPRFFITDGLPAYAHAADRAFFEKSTGPFANLHIAAPPMQVGPDMVHPNNSILERLNGSVRERLKVMRGFDGEAGAKTTLDAWRFYYNFIRPHQGIGGLTPAQMAGLSVPLNGNRWLAIIQRASAR